MRVRITAIGIILFAVYIALTTPAAAGIQAIYESPVEVGTTVNLTLLVTDSSGALVNGTTPIQLATSSKYGGFMPGPTQITNLTAIDGFISVNYLVGNAGDNFISIQTSGPDPMQIISIEGRATAPPVKITSEIYPGWVYADGDPTHVFIVTYHLYDAHGFPSGNRSITVTSNLGETVTTASNYLGTVSVKYGPKIVAGNYTLIARAVDNLTVTNTVNLVFSSTAAKDMYLTANPQTLPSNELNPAARSGVAIKTIDERGNPVTGESVKFKIISVTAPGQVNPPTIDGVGPGIEITKITGANGDALVSFASGSFVPLGTPGWNQSAKGSAVIQGNWDGMTRFITLHWENFPFVSLNVTATPLSLDMNGTVDITIKMVGDGYALQPKPIDVVLTTDRSGSMGSDTPTRLSQVKAASKVFVAQLNYGRDKAGLVSFGGTATVNQQPTNSPLAINTSIDGMTANGYTPMRDAIYKAINEIKTNGRTSTVKAIVVLSDGDYNYFGDPLARGSPGQVCTASHSVCDKTCNFQYCKSDGSQGTSRNHKYHRNDCISSHTVCDAYGTAPGDDAQYQTNLNPDYYPYTGLGTGPFSEQNMSVYAKNNMVRIYTIAYTSEVTQGGKDTLRYLAEQTGGTYYEAPSNGDLVGIYVQIAGALRYEAGIGTTMNVNMGSVVINNKTVPGITAFDYVHEDGISTTVHSWNETGDVIPLQTIDQTANWTANQSLPFDIGTIYLGQIWEGKYRLKVKLVGLINIFGPGSEIRFADGSSIILPDTYINCIDWSGQGALGNATNLDLHDLYSPDTMPANQRVRIRWNLTYKGHGEVTTLFYFAYPDQPDKWMKLSEVIETPAGQETTQEKTLTFSQSFGSTTDYLIKVEAFSSEGGYDKEGPILVSVYIPQYYIKIT